MLSTYVGATAIVAFALSASFVAAVLKTARKHAWFDEPDERKIHTGQIPRLGGIGFSSAFVLVVALLTSFFPESLNGLTYHGRFMPVFFAMVLILAFGVLDDFRPLRPRWKLLVQIAAAILVMTSDFGFHRLFFPGLGPSVELGLIRYPITLLWIVGVTNAVNLIDGVDGLAGGFSFIASVTLALIFFSAGNASVALLCVALAFSVAGFLIFNLPLPRARIFMGDCGSQLLGFVLAVLPLLDNGSGGASLPLPYAAALLLIPIFDTFSAIWRRLRAGRRIDSPDKSHMHHKLMVLGLDARGVDAVVWSLQAVLGLLVVLSLRSAGIVAGLALCAAYVLGAGFFSAVHFLNRWKNENQEIPR